MPEDIERTLGKILASQEATERRLTGIESVLAEVVRIDERQRAHQTDDDRRNEALQKDIDRAHKKIEAVTRTFGVEPESRSKKASKVAGIIGLGAGIGAGLREWFK